MKNKEYNIKYTKSGKYKVAEFSVYDRQEIPFVLKKYKLRLTKQVESLFFTNPYDDPRSNGKIHVAVKLETYQEKFDCYTKKILKRVMKWLTVRRSILLIFIIAIISLYKPLLTICQAGVFTLWILNMHKYYKMNNKIKKL